MKTIGIIGAMPSELADIREILDNALIETHSGFEFYINIIDDLRVVNVCCGIAKVNAAVCTQVMIDRYDLDAVINTGIAGGMNPNVKVCDIVVSSEVMPHDLELRFLEDYPPYNSVFKADKSLIKIAEDACIKHGIKSFTGSMVSGEAFICSNEEKDRIVEKFNPFSVDMESSAIGHCCYLNNVSFVSVRCISDNADDNGAMSFDEFEKVAAKQVAEIVIAMLKCL